MQNLLFSLVSILLASPFSFGQTGDLIITTETGKSFIVFVDEVPQNDEAEPMLHIQDIPQGNHHLNIRFEDENLANIDVMECSIAGEQTLVFTFAKSKKEGWKNTPVGPLENNDSYLSYFKHATTVPFRTSIPMETEATFAPEKMVTTGDTIINGDTLSYTKTQYTYSSQLKDSIKVEPARVYTSGYLGAVGCPKPLTLYDFEKSAAQIEAMVYPESKLEAAKTMSESNCLTVEQVKTICSLFDSDKFRLKYAKFAYEYTYDQGNYYQLEEVFDSRMTMLDLDRYLEDFNDR